MSSISASTSVQDTWNPQTATQTRIVTRIVQRKPKQTQPVPDEWDNDDEESVDSEKVWQQANTQTPMPQVILSSSSTARTAVAPPPEALQGPLRILKRPNKTPSPGVNGGVSPSASLKSLKEREKEYQAARDRIFASSSGGGGGSPSPSPGGNGGTGGTGAGANGDAQPGGTSSPRSEKQKAGTQQGASSVIRNPRGPTEGTSGEAARGFGGKRGSGAKRSPPTGRSSASPPNGDGDNDNAPPALIDVPDSGDETRL
ncbi:hypothetical protein BD410DRAFT_871175 [Rickenella mellea]|uniref:SUZ domain-containing protein n=1 Tax=Rickenella mellea TaxID=50990 RepID=A0A4Y7Q088_9AGAM|nr:hypothetical protein BD410DRAFT_871175 [Rickenella mellea]